MNTISSTPTLRLGSQGASVKELQMLLNRRTAATLVVDGVFSKTTESAVREFQLLFFLTVDGVVGPQTWRALQTGAPVDMPMIARNSTGLAVKKAQEALKALQIYKGNVDGIFGIQTEAAIKSFQQNHGLRVDGIVGPQTWTKLSAVWVGFVVS